MISVVIPSKSKPHQSRFLLAAIESIRRQTECEIIVAVDNLEVREFSGVKFVQGAGGQPNACNAGAAAATGDYLCFLEDDDRWLPLRLPEALEALKEGDFTSCTQLEVSTEGDVIRINDFPTPSGWMMRRKVWDEVGPFDPKFRYHLDNEWLGRLSRTDFRRIHLVEATAPQTYEEASLYRPWLASIVKQGGMYSSLKRTRSERPLIERLIHRGSNCGTLEHEPQSQKISQNELKALTERYGFIPR